MASDNEILLTIKAETDKARKEISALKKTVDSLSKSSSKTDKNLGSSSKAMKSLNTQTKTLTKTLGGLATAWVSLQGASALVSTMADIEQGFIGIQKTTGATDEELKNFEDGIYSLVESMHGISIGELQSIAEGAGQLGVAKEDILQFTESIAKISVATGVSAEQVSTDMAVLANVFKIPVEEIENLGSSVNELSATTAGTVDAIINSTKRMAGVGKSFGLTADEVMAFGATMADVGIRTEVGATAFGQILQKMQTDTEKFAKEAGLDVAEFTDLMKNEPKEAMVQFLEAFDGIDDKASALKNLGLSGGGLSQTMLGLSGNTEKLRKNLETSNRAFKEGTSINNEYEKVSDSIDAKTVDLKNAFVLLSRELMTALQPAIKSAMDSMIEFISSVDSQAIGDFAGETIKSAEAIAEWVDANGEMLIMIGKVSVGIYGLVKAYGMLQKLGMVDFAMSAVKNGASILETIGKITTAVALLAKGMYAMVMSNPYTMAITALVATMGYMVTKSYEWADAIEAEEEHLKDLEGVMSRVTREYTKFNNSLDENGNLILKSKEAKDSYLKSLRSTLTAMAKQIDLWKEEDPEGHAKKIEVLTGQMESLGYVYNEVASVSAESIETEKEKIKIISKVTKAHQENVTKFIEGETKKRDSAKQSYEQMKTDEKNLISDLKKLQEELHNIRQKYANKRLDLEDEIAEKIRKANQTGMTDEQKYADDKIASETALGKAREEIAKKNFEQAEKYLTDYESLVSDITQYELENGEKIGVTKSEAIQSYTEKLGVYGELSKVIQAEEEANEIKIHNLKITYKQIELKALQKQMEIQVKILKKMDEILNKSKNITKESTEADYQDLLEDIKEFGKEVEKLEGQKIDVKVGVKTDLANARTNIDKLKKDASEPIKTNLEVETKNSDKKIQDSKDLAQEDVTFYTYADTTDAEGNVTRLIQMVDGTVEEITVDAKEGNITAKLDEMMMNIIDTEGYVTIDAQLVDDIDGLGSEVQSRIGTVTVLTKAEGMKTTFDEEIEKVNAEGKKVTVGAETSQIPKDIDAEFGKLDANGYSVKVTLDTTADDFGIDKFVGKTVKVDAEVDADVAPFQEKIDRLREELKDPTNQFELITEMKLEEAETELQDFIKNSKYTVEMGINPEWTKLNTKIEEFRNKKVGIEVELKVDASKPKTEVDNFVKETNDREALIAIGIEKDIAKKQAEDLVAEISEFEATIKTKYEDGGAETKLSELKDKLDKLQGVLTVDANVQIAKDKIEALEKEMHKSLIHVSADTSKYKTDVDSSILETNNKTAIVKVGADTTTGKSDVELMAQAVGLVTANIQVGADGTVALTDTQLLLEQIRLLEAQITVGMDASKAKRELANLKKTLTNLKAKVGVTADIRTAENKIKTLGKNINVMVNVDANTSSATGKINALKAPTKSMHNVDGDASRPMGLIATLKLPTESVHTIHVYKEEHFSTGGEVLRRKEGGLIGDGIQRLAEGGYSVRQGFLGGFGGGDRIKSLLEAGEFIQRKEAVKKYGVGFMNMINTLMLPIGEAQRLVSGAGNVNKMQTGGAVRRYAEGGEVAPLSANIETRNIALNFIDNDGSIMRTMTDEDTAEKIENYLRKFAQ